MGSLRPIEPEDFEERRPLTPAERDAEIVWSTRSHLRLVSEGVAHITDPDHVCSCVYPPDWVDIDGILADQLEGLRMCVEHLTEHRREHLGHRRPD